MCYTVSLNDKNTNIYTRKELVLMETYIAEFHQNFYIPEIRKLEFHFPRVLILCKHHFNKEHRDVFKRQGSYKYFLYYRDYAELVVVIFENQIQLEYYGGNISLYIEVI